LNTNKATHCAGEQNKYFLLPLPSYQGALQYCLLSVCTAIKLSLFRSLDQAASLLLSNELQAIKHSLGHEEPVL
jgi:hypothetical protein